MKKRPYLVDIVVGTRPNIVKAGPLFRALREANWCLPRLVYLAQHTATAMTTDTFSDVGIPQEEVHRLDLSAVGFGARMGEMVQKYSDHLTKSPPAVVLVLGDVDSTFAAAYAAKRMHVPVAHIEAGLRSGDLSMPEELNRRMVDTISDLLLTTTEGACTNLRLEGRSESEIHFTGNLMIDSLRRTLADPLLDDRVCVLKEQYRLTDSDYILATFHRPSNVDAPNHIQHVTTVLQAAAKRLPVLSRTPPKQTRPRASRHSGTEQRAPLAATPLSRLHRPAFVSPPCHHRLGWTAGRDQRTRNSLPDVPSEYRTTRNRLSRHQHFGGP